MLGNRLNVSSIPASNQQVSRAASLICRAASNGASQNGSSHSLGKNQQTVEMHIASTDTYEDYNNANGLKRRNSVHVTPPRNEAPQRLERHHTSSLTPPDAVRSEIKAVKAELSMTNAELRSRDTELAESERHLRAREAEVALLRAALTGRDISLRNAKLEAAEAQEQIKDKDRELQNAFEQLVSNAKERADLRQRLLTIQQELSETRLELGDWTEKGFDLNQPVQASNNGAKPPSTARSAEKDQLTKLLENLSRLSKTIADDAQEDEKSLKQFAS